MRECLVVLLLANLAWAKPVLTYCADPDWWPFEIIQQGRHLGMAADLMALAAERAEIELQLVPSLDWPESLALARAGECMALSFLNETESRQRWLSFSKPLLIDPNVLVTHARHENIRDLNDFAYKVMVLPKGTAVEERVRRDFPHIDILLVDTELQAFEAVNQGLADMTLRSQAIAVSAITDGGFFNLKVAGRVPGYENVLRMALLHEHEHWLPLLNLGIARLEPDEVRTIYNRYVSVRVDQVTDYRLFYLSLLVLLVVTLTSAFWLWRMQRINEQLKFLSERDSLTKIWNRRALSQFIERAP